MLICSGSASHQPFEEQFDEYLIGIMLCLVEGNGFTISGNPVTNDKETVRGFLGRACIELDSSMVYVYIYVQLVDQAHQSV